MDILTLSFWKSITDSLVVFPLLIKYAQRQFGSFPQIPVGMNIKKIETTTQSHIVNFANSNLQIFGLVVHHRLGCRRRWRDPSRDVGLYAKCSRERSGEIYTVISWCLIHRFNWFFTYLYYIFLSILTKWERVFAQKGTSKWTFLNYEIREKTNPCCKYPGIKDQHSGQGE